MPDLSCNCLPFYARSGGFGDLLLVSVNCESDWDTDNDAKNCAEPVCNRGVPKVCVTDSEDEIGDGRQNKTRGKCPEEAGFRFVRRNHGASKPNRSNCR